MPVVWRLERRVELSKNRRAGNEDRLSGLLIQPLVVGEEPRSVLLDRAAKRAAVLISAKQRIERRIRTEERRERRKAVVTEEQEPRSVIGVGPSTRNNIHSSNGSDARREVKAERRYLEFLNRLS